MTSAKPSPAQWRYGLPAIVLHWVLALLIATMATIGWIMMSIEHTPLGDQLVALHKSIGITVLLLVAARIAWRSGHRPAPLPEGLPRWQVRASEWIQWALYACMVGVPVTGLLGAGFQRSGVAFFGYALPRWAAANRPRAELLFDIHSALVWATVVLVVLHALAGLKHLLLDRDQVFQRMWFS